MPRDVRANARYGRALHAVHELLTKLRLDFAFLGGVARAAWLGGEVAAGPIDVLAVMSPEQKNNVCMMASNRGFRVDRGEVEGSEELDLIPLHFVDADGEIKAHVLVASNALYGRMVAGAAAAELDGVAIKVPSREDYALLVAMSGDEVALHALASSEEFDRGAYNGKLLSIGLGEHVIA
jgi:hypothetical protein